MTAAAPTSISLGEQVRVRAPHRAPCHRVMSVFEHQRLQVQDFEVAADFGWLIAQELSVFSIKRMRGHWQLKVGHYIGIVMLPSGIVLEILPKAVTGHQSDYGSHNDVRRQTRHWVQRMLTDITSGFGARTPHTQHIGQLSRHIAPFDAKAQSLSEWLVGQFLQRLTSYLPSQQYQTQVRNETALQGKLLIKAQLQKNAHQPHKMACEVSLLSQEMVGNRLIKSALLLIEPMALSLVASDAPLMRTLSAWRHIRALTYPERMQLPNVYAQAKRQLACQPLSAVQQRAASAVLEMAYWLLQMQQKTPPTGSSLNLSDQLGQSKVPADASPLHLCVLINMNQAFEQWASLRIAAAVKHASNNYQTLAQPRDVWLSDEAGEACLSVQPDLLLYHQLANSDSTSAAHTESQSHCSHVIDIKWKYLPQASAISASDAYQLLSYAQAYQARQVWLVYPVTSATTKPIALHAPNPHASPQATLWLMPFNVITGKLNIKEMSAFL